MGDWIPWFNLGLNVVGVAMMVHFGLPQGIPFFGKPDGDPLLGLVGLAAFGCSIVIRVSTILYAGS